MFAQKSKANWIRSKTMELHKFFKVQREHVRQVQVESIALEQDWKLKWLHILMAKLKKACPWMVTFGGATKNVEPFSWINITMNCTIGRTWVHVSRAAERRGGCGILGVTFCEQLEHNFVFPKVEADLRPFLFFSQSL